MAPPLIDPAFYQSLLGHGTARSVDFRLFAQRLLAKHPRNRVRFGGLLTSGVLPSSNKEAKIMLNRTTCFLLQYLVALTCVVCDPSDSVAQRALDYARGWANHREEPIWGSHYVPEYVHPDANDSGLPGRYPSFAPSIEHTAGLFLIQDASVARITSGFSPWVLGGGQGAYAVEVTFKVVGVVSDRVSLYSQPVLRSQVVILAQDSSDSKWKVVDRFPYGAYFYQIPYFLKSWEKIKGRGSVKNIAEVRDRLLALANQKSP